MNNERKIMKLKYRTMQSPEYCIKKKERMEMIKKLHEQRVIKNPRDYLVTSNSVYGHKRIESRNKINSIIIAKAESTNGK